MQKLIKDIYKNEEELFRDYSLLGGAAGYLLLLYYLKEDDKLYTAIQKVITDFTKKDYFVLYSAGLAGLLWVLNLINNDERITYLDEVINDLNDILNSTMDNNIGESFDFLHDITGIIHYLVDCSNNDQSKEIINKYLLDLKKSSIKSKQGLSIQFFQPIEKINLTNFSLSHGMAAVIQVLSRIYKKGIETKLSKELLEGYISFILNNKQDVEKIGSNFPSTLEGKDYRSRLGWCYGDLGTAISIWQAGDNTGNIEWKQIAENILIQTTTRTTLEDGMVLDPMVCHGSSGIAAIYNRMWRNTNNKVFLIARDHWLEKTKEFPYFADGVAGYKFFMPGANNGKGEWITQYGLLEGAVGLALTFLQAESKEDIRWDKALLICS